MFLLGLLLSVGGFFAGLVNVVHVIVCIFLILVVLLQSGKSGDLAGAFGGGGSQANIAAMSSENILTRATKYSAFTFMATSLILALGTSGGGQSVLDVVPGDDAPAAVSAIDGDAAADSAADTAPATAPSTTPVAATDDAAPAAGDASTDDASEATPPSDD